MSTISVKKGDKGFFVSYGGKLLTPDDLTHNEVCHFVSKGNLPAKYIERKEKEKAEKEFKEKLDIDIPDLTVKEIKERLGYFDIEYDKSLKKNELLELLVEAMENSEFVEELSDVPVNEETHAEEDNDISDINNLINNKL
jgi:hypothetical protein